MAGPARRPKLGVFVNGIPDFENLFHLLKRLQARGRVELRIYTTSKLLRLEPRTREMFVAANLDPVVRPNRLMKWPIWYRRVLADLDALLTLGDPLNDQSSHGHRTAYCTEINLPTIYLQHGVIQEDVTYRKHDRAIDFSSGLIFLFEELADNRSLFAPGVTERMKVSGFLKTTSLPPKTPSPSFMNELSNYRKRLLFCHSFRWAGRYSGADIERFNRMIEAFARENRDIAIIIRAHRGKRRGIYSDHDKALKTVAPNIYFSYQYSGPFKGMVMSDVIGLSDAVVSTASTALLDALYAGRPTAVYLNESEKFGLLPQVSDAASLTEFMSTGATKGMDEIVARYGDVDTNIERACDRIEAALSNWGAA